MINENIIKGKWQEIKGDIQKRWGKLTNDDLEKAKGDVQNLAGLIQQRYGMAQEEVKKGLDEFLAKYVKPSTDDSKDESKFPH